ncbi:MAG: UbiA prenyltransferase family protein [Candidatus Binatia bacterium]
MRALRPYLSVCRPDHWFKNVFMLAGTIAAVLHPQNGITVGLPLLLRTIEAFAISCLAASANYVINEILDADRDALHPTKRHRPVPSALVHVPILWGIAAGLAIVSLVWSWWSFSAPFTLSIAALLAQGFLYNVPPVRTKEVAYLDVVSESVNNPIRLLVGWYATGIRTPPPLSLFLGYWVFGGFLMSAKRFAEYRFLGDAVRAAAYRSSFRGYTEESLLIAMICYASLTTFFYGVLLVRYHLFDLFLSVPFMVAFLAWFFHLAFRPDSIVKEPERLYQAPAFATYCAFLFSLIVFLVAADLSFLWEWLNELRIGVPLPEPA